MKVKSALDKVKQARKALFKIVGIGERDWTPLKQKVGGFLSAGVSYWKSTGGP